MKKPLVFLATLGFPGSGKTYFSERLAKKYSYFLLNADRLRLEIFEKPKYDAKENQRFFLIMDYIAEELLSRGVSVIFDSNATKFEFRRKFMRIAKRQGAQYVLLWFKTTTSLALRRLSKRRQLKQSKKQKYYRPIDDSVLYRIQKEEEVPRKEPHLVIPGNSRFSEQVRVYEDWLHA